MPPIIINSTQHYPQAVTQPVSQPVSQPVPQYINRPHTNPSQFATIPVANAQPISVNWNRSGNYINQPHTHPVSFAKSLDDENDIFVNFYTPNKPHHYTPNLKTLQNYY